MLKLKWHLLLLLLLLLGILLVFKSSWLERSLLIVVVVVAVPKQVFSVVNRHIANEFFFSVVDGQ